MPAITSSESIEINTSVTSEGLSTTLPQSGSKIFSFALVLPCFISNPVPEVRKK